jgi:very-short-patch-repair endonuclease
VKDDTQHQVCSRCHEFKLCHFHWSRRHYHKKVWVCQECLKKPSVPRLARKSEETPIEREAREALERIGVKAYSEFSMGPYIFDFVLPRHRLILEIDSDSYHNSRRQRGNDQQKDEWAKRNHWLLVRIRAPDIAQQVVHAVSSRRLGLG